MGVVGKDRGLESWEPWYHAVGDVSEGRQGVVEHKNKYVLTVGRREAANNPPPLRQMWHGSNMYLDNPQTKVISHVVLGQ
ncbi:MULTISPECIES: hypothetical protein [Paenibacillus]|uniref:Uncharacterized protein n=1 Tax=Paenibacillus lautus TaxID=1401 RepID=A0A1R1BA07_PAELA|nr:hypothetical protein [Paenibacillus lautus]OME96930.1 hypothetical protein BK123_04970 [Paenibacillus lautus]